TLIRRAALKDLPDGEKVRDVASGNENGWQVDKRKVRQQGIGWIIHEMADWGWHREHRDDDDVEQRCQAGDVPKYAEDSTVGPLVDPGSERGGKPDENVEVAAFECHLDGYSAIFI